MKPNEVMNSILQHEEFAKQLTTIADMGSGDGQQSHMWSTAILPSGKPLSPMVFAVDDNVQMDNHYRTNRIRPLMADWSDTGIGNGKLDMIWCINSFQYAWQPFQTLSHWHDILNTNGLLVISVPQCAYIDDLSRWQIEHQSGCFHSWNMVNLIYTLATCGFDCGDGFFYQRRHDPMLWAAVYKSDIEPMHPKTTTWYHLAEHNLLPKSVLECVNYFGYVKHEFLTLPWLDGSLSNLAIESIP